MSLIFLLVVGSASIEVMPFDCCSNWLDCTLMGATQNALWLCRSSSTSVASSTVITAKTIKHGHHNKPTALLVTEHKVNASLHNTQFACALKINP